MRGKPVDVLIEFEIEDEDDLLDYQLLNNEEFKKKIAKSANNLSVAII
jgi:hypothetical protein